MLYIDTCVLLAVLGVCRGSGDRLSPTEPRGVWSTDAERSRLQAASTKPGQRHPPATPHRHHRRLASERRQRLIQLPAGPGRHRATAAKAKGRRSAAR
jgi:hypothetical protein